MKKKKEEKIKIEPRKVSGNNMVMRFTFNSKYPGVKREREREMQSHSACAPIQNIFLPHTATHKLTLTRMCIPQRLD